MDDADAGPSANYGTPEDIPQTEPSGDSGSVPTSPDLLLHGISVKLRELVQGFGGLTAFNRLLVQASFIPGIAALSSSLQSHLIRWQRSLGIADPDIVRKRADDYQVRKFRAVQLLGPQRFFEASRDLFLSQMEPTPEVVVMWDAYSSLGRGYKKAYEALGVLFQFFADWQGQEAFRIADPQFVRYLELSRYEYIKGETRISVPEKALSCFVVYGNLARLEREKAEAIIDAGVNVARLGYITELLDGSFRDLFDEASRKFWQMYADMLPEVLPKVTQALTTDMTPDISYEVPRQEVYSHPFLLAADTSTWTGGTLAGRIGLQAFPAPIYAYQDEATVTGIVAAPGRGKTALMSGIACASVLSKGYAVLQPSMDDSNSLAFSCLPVFAYDRRSEKLVASLKQRLGLDPMPVPLIILDVVASDDTSDLEGHPLTVFDRLVKVDNPQGFGLDFAALRDELDESRAVLESWGYGPYKPHSGIIALRNLHRVVRVRDRWKELELQLALSTLLSFDEWREKHRQDPWRIMIDEVADYAPSVANFAGADQSAMGAVIGKFIRRARRKNAPFDWSSQRATETIPILKDLSTNIIFKDLPQSPRKEQSQIDYVLDMLQVDNRGARDAVSQLNRANALKEGYLWFWYHRPSREINLIGSLPPTFMLEIVKASPVDVFHKYEAMTGHRVLSGLPAVPDITQRVIIPAQHPGGLKEDPRRPRGRPPKDDFSLSDL